MKMTMHKANKIDDIYNSVMATPLAISELDQFYRDTDVARSQFSTRKKLQRKIEQNAANQRNAHILFVGNRGCGKSTELNHLQKDLQDKYMVLNYNVTQELDPQSIQYIELFIVTMERLFRMALDENLDIDKDFLNKVIEWTKTSEIEQIKKTHFSAEVETGAEVEHGLPFLAKFFLKFKAAAKASKSFKQTIKNTLEPRLADLIQHCNNLIGAIRKQIQLRGLTDLVIFIEDLDKIPVNVAKELFYNYANQLTQLRAIVVYTFPVSLFHNIHFGDIRNYFTHTEELPMIKVREKNGDEHADGIEVMKQIIDARINRGLFATEEVIKDFVLNSGGVIRDMFTMLNEAAMAAYFSKSAQINKEHFRYAVNYLKNEYRNTIADYTDDKGKVRPAAEFYEAMQSLMDRVDKKIDNSDVILILRQNLCILSYNGEGWCDVHPIVKIIVTERATNR